MDPSFAKFPPRWVCHRFPPAETSGPPFYTFVLLQVCVVRSPFTPGVHVSRSTAAIALKVKRPTTRACGIAVV